MNVKMEDLIVSKKRMKKITPEPITLVTSEPVAISPIQAAMQAGASPSELLQFMELQERHDANEARKAFVLAMSKFRADCPTIKKTEDGHNCKHASIAGTLNQIKGLMSENGLSHSWRTNQEGSQISVTCVVTHSLGHSEQTTLTAAPDTSGSKNAIQAIGSTVKYLERYTLEACLGLASSEEGDDDGQASSAELISEDAAMRLHAMLIDGGLDEDGAGRVERYIAKELKISGFSAVNTNSYEWVLSVCKESIKRKQNENS